MNFAQTTLIYHCTFPTSITCLHFKGPFNFKIFCFHFKSPFNFKIPCLRLKIPFNFKIPCVHLKIPFNFKIPCLHFKIPFNFKTHCLHPKNTLLKGSKLEKRAHPIEMVDGCDHPVSFLGLGSASTLQKSRVLQEEDSKQTSDLPRQCRLREIWVTMVLSQVQEVACLTQGCYPSPKTLEDSKSKCLEGSQFWRGNIRMRCLLKR